MATEVHSNITRDPATTNLLKFVPTLLEQICTINGQPLRWEDWQRDIVGSTEIREIRDKARQIGFSFAAAGRGLGRSFILPPSSYTCVFVSFNQDDAAEKIRYARQLYDGISDRYRKKLIKDNDLELEFENHNRLISLPSQPVMGKANVDLILDEMAHIAMAEAVYQRSQPSTIRGSWGILVGSTPFGLGYFQRMCDQAGKPGEFSLFKHVSIPWWESAFLCKDPEGAKLLAPFMTTEERLELYGTEAIKTEFRSHTMEFFRQEFECASFDSANSVLTHQLVLRQSDPNVICHTLDVDCENDVLQVMELLKILIDNILFNGITNGYIGYDVGRERHASELILVTPKQGAEDELETRAYITLRRANYPLQQQVVAELMNRLPIRRLVVDQQGIGNQISEWAELTFGPDRVTRMTFAPLLKEEMVATLIKFFESSWLWIKPTVRLHNQLLSVRKVTSSTGKLLYRSETKKESNSDEVQHADLFWALAEAVWGFADATRNAVHTTRRSPFLFGVRQGYSGLFQGRR